MSSAQPLLGPGTMLGETYELRALLGEGAMGEVWEAWDETLARRVAVKFPRPNARRDLRDEARALAALRHPSLVSVFAMGTHEGVPFMVTELVPGVTWSTELARMSARGHPPPALESLEIAVQVAEALAVIHDSGLTHGDVKPANVLLAPQRVVLTDLGLAHVRSRVDEPPAGGTPAYAAPELISGKVDPQFAHLADVYALGVTLFEALAGRRPFVATGSAELAYLHVHAPVPRLVDLVPVPRRLSALVASMMAKDPLDRPDSMAALVFQLKALGKDLTGEEPSSLEVLVVDDDADIARLLGFYVREEVADARVDIVNDAFSALEHMRERSPHLLLLDLSLPGMSGFELHAYLRGSGLLRTCTVVAVSAAANADDEALLTDLGVHACVTKDGALRARIRAFVRAFASARLDSTPPSSRRPPSIRSPG